jgi:carotenoid 1,2-hydratase
MNILSDPKKDVRSYSHEPGGYEWWYFDGTSGDGKYSFVIIFYEGNPFSTRYNARLLNSESDPMPDEFPAVSISIYENGKTIYYSFTEFEPPDCMFSEDRPMVKIGDSQMKAVTHDGKMNYILNIEETLPSGNAIGAHITFESPETNLELFGQQEEDKTEHQWNLVQPRACVNGKIQLRTHHEGTQNITFVGKGYHDHNTGREPMYGEFSDWYWGRFHFEYATFVYYVMNCQDEEQNQAWLISNDNSTILEVFSQIDLVDKGLTFFGLKTARKIGLRSKNTEVQIQQNRLLDNGPFYQRFYSDAFLRIPGENIVESREGICEYIRPDRITNRVFWPLINMRIYYKSENPHWVQRSKTLYRWTW